ncbi:hypothetical protein F8M41_022484 [Gigaspora margarita]|uniref:Uncharacterized protein n=1 Tax=Gigaspora margarita TaxID=4874 RepID=A0A8H4AEX7_GIGMA|nr:hypothetical protein F8M41_022484 [Gigaspora margarita]
MEFINTMETRRSAKEIGIFVVTNNINIEKLKNIASSERNIIICQFNEIAGYIEQIEQRNMIEMLTLYNNISSAESCINNPNLSIEDLKKNLLILKSHLEKISGIKDIMSCNTKKYNDKIKELNKALEQFKLSN